MIDTNDYQKFADKYKYEYRGYTFCFGVIYKDNEPVVMFPVGIAMTNENVTHAKQLIDEIIEKEG